MTQNPTNLTPEQAALLELYRTARPAFHREEEILLARWCCEAVRRMRILVLGRTLNTDETVSLADGMRSFDDLLAQAERHGLRARLEVVLDDIRARWLFRRNQPRVPNRHAA